jgi:hypothetical protein
MKKNDDLLDRIKILEGTEWISTENSTPKQFDPFSFFNS